jgi:ThiF family protein/E2/UBC family protein C
VTRRQSQRTEHLLDQLADGRGKELIRRLEPGRVILSLSKHVAFVPQAQLCFTFAVNLAARLHPVIQNLTVILDRGHPASVEFAKWHAPILDEHISRLLGALEPPLRWSVEPTTEKHADICLAFGEPPKQALRSDSVIYVGSNGWDASVSAQSGLAFGPKTNPIGAYAAACMGVAEVWKRLLYPYRELISGVPILPTDNSLTFSTFTYRALPDEQNPPLHESLDVRALTIIGLGAGGGAAAFTLASLQELSGKLNLVEPDEVDGPNLNRCVFADSHDAAAARAKAIVIKELFNRHPRLVVKPYAEPFSKIAEKLSAEDYKYVLAAVHSREARRELQYETPMVLWDGGATDDGEFRIWRMIFGMTECMHCKHPLSEKDPETEKAKQVAHLLGLTADACLRKLRDNEPFTDEEIRTITSHLGPQTLPFEPPRQGQRFGDWETSQCGRIVLPDADHEIPIPFAPVMSGVLLAGEIIKEHHFPDQVLDSYYWNTLMGRFMRDNRPWRRGPNPTCALCSDPAYIEQHERRQREATII